MSDASFLTYGIIIVPSPLGSSSPRGIPVRMLKPEDEISVILQNARKYPHVDAASCS
jgi:hypothetical protein